MSDDPAIRMDPVTFEILRHRLQQNVMDMTKAVEKVSGSPVVLYAGDHMESIYDAEGNLVLAGMACTHTTLPTGKVAKYILKTFESDPGIYEDDQFFFNDPYISGIHNNDMAVVGPIHYGAEMVGWAGAVTHCLDTGGTFPGGMSPWSRDMFQDGFRIPGLKLMDRGKVRSDAIRTLANLCRLPELITLDTKAKMAAINVAKERIQAMCHRYGVETVKQFFHELMNYSEKLARAKLEKIPDGEWESSTYLDDPAGDIFEIHCVMRKEKGHVTLDFTGSSPQSSYGINASASATMGGCFVGLAGFLFPNIPWNEGMYRVVDFVLPEGTVVNATQPAATAANMPTGTSMLIESLIQELVAYMLYAVPEYRREVYCPTWGASADFQMSGLDQRNRFYVTIGFNVMGAGGGARFDKDGCNSAGWQGSPISWVPNVESSELFYPMLYLWRRELPDSGGPGKFRGGAGLEVAFKLHDAGNSEARVAGIGGGFEPMNIVGLSGGYPAMNPYMTLVKEASLENLPTCLAEIQGKKESLAPKALFGMQDGDALMLLSGPGGGGWGDPLEREPRLVLKDLMDGYVSREAAAEIYGVIVDMKLRIDEKATATKRQSLRKKRIPEQKSPTADPDSVTPHEDLDVYPLGEYLRLNLSRKVFQCSRCGYSICAIHENWKEHILLREQCVSGTQRFVLRELFCPFCYVCMKVDMVRTGTPLVRSFRLLGLS
ncbi:MAG: hydantoinase B/oxoprolinase family protein [Deltaproteobacteria bacterium]|nr:hydantoinase B/oxoprolinase family protein [Deltaproteobacteria bacterium]